MPELACPGYALRLVAVLAVLAGACSDSCDTGGVGSSDRVQVTGADSVLAEDGEFADTVDTDLMDRSSSGPFSIPVAGPAEQRAVCGEGFVLLAEFRNPDNGSNRAIVRYDFGATESDVVFDAACRISPGTPPSQRIGRHLHLLVSGCTGDPFERSLSLYDTSGPDPHVSATLFTNVLHWPRWQASSRPVCALDEVELSFRCVSGTAPFDIVASGPAASLSAGNYGVWTTDVDGFLSFTSFSSGERSILGFKTARGTARLDVVTTSRGDTYALRPALDAPDRVSVVRLDAEGGTVETVLEVDIGAVDDLVQYSLGGPVLFAGEDWVAYRPESGGLWMAGPSKPPLLVAEDVSFASLVWDRDSDRAAIVFLAGGTDTCNRVLGVVAPGASSQLRTIPGGHNLSTLPTVGFAGKYVLTVAPPTSFATTAGQCLYNEAPLVALDMESGGQFVLAAEMGIGATVTMGRTGSVAYVVPAPGDPSPAQRWELDHPSEPTYLDDVRAAEECGACAILSVRTSGDRVPAAEQAFNHLAVCDDRP